MIASCHEPGEPVKASTVTAMSPHGVSGLRVLEVLFAAGDDLVVWITVLRHGTPRRRAVPVSPPSPCRRPPTPS
ncbi:hypothetical protein [Actinoplanes regularis]|uniref:hypothetical protein n=1 Tax=Actinoplanes regularis TaxID=52697 RepID=UPI000B792628|nr:hypothetical protein [Actinoplanes regularis]